REGIEPQIENLQNLPLDIFPWWMKKLEANKPIAVSRVADMPEEASTEREILQSQSILSVAVVPLFVNKQLFGFAGFDSVNQEKEWELESIALLQQFGNSLSNLLERKRVENALRQSEERNTAILKAIPDNMFRISAHGEILDFIASDYSSLLMPPDQIKGTHLSVALGDELYAIALQKIQAAIETRQIQSMTYHVSLHSQPEHFEARFMASGPDEVIGIVRNVSERARLEQMKSDFINRATHDLRTPLTTILLMVRLLEGECTPEERTQYWTILKEELERERVLIEDLLTVGRLESNQWHVKSQPVDPFESLQNSIQTILPQASQKNIQINFTPFTDRFIVIGELSSLEQVFTNLLNNAVKFTPAGGSVEISYCRQGRKGVFKVQDNGIGIPPEDMPHLYT
ncbi:MAG TPA: histidine kinase dimerization/phospho-acceptor domain-containing protein, partial [Pseudomonadales bacterium]|nr:histidine kinase dimerization/phospho-acceptor domain-containing protein [Pseudomonadales bacterium]